MPPVFALAEQQSVAEQRTQHPHRREGTAVTVGIVNEDMMDPGGPIKNDLLTSKKAAVDHVLFESLGRKGQEGVVAQRLGDSSPRERGGRRVGRREDQWLRFGHSGYPLVTIRYAGDRNFS